MTFSTGTNPDIPILFEDNHILVLQKPIHILSQEDSSGDPDLLTLSKQYLKSRYDKPGNVFLGLLHRLDRPVTGVIVLAKTSKAASRISEQIRKRTFRKRYLAIVHGKTAPNGVLIHHLLKDPDTKTVHVARESDKKALKAELSYIRKKFNEERNLSLLQINLLTGRPHQIRVQFSAEGYPLHGDKKYGKPDTSVTGPALAATEVRFRHPVSDSPVIYSCAPPDHLPWSWFRNGG